MTEPRLAPKDAALPGASLPMDRLDLPQRGLNACRQLGVKTVADFLARDRAEFLAVKNCGPATYAKLERLVRAALDERTASDGAPGSSREATLLPAGLLGIPVADLGVQEAVARQLHELALHTVGELLALENPEARLGCDVSAAVRVALRDLLAEGLGSCDRASITSLACEMLDALHPPHSEVVRSLVGIGCPALAVQRLAVQLACTPIEMRERIAAARRHLHDRAGPQLDELRELATRRIDQSGGIATASQLDPAAAHNAAPPTRSGGLPTRLLTFCFPDEFFPLGDRVTCASPHRIADLRAAVRRWRRHVQFPVAVAELDAHLERAKLRVPGGLLRHVLAQVGLTVSSDPLGNELITSRHDAVTDYVLEILSEAPGPLRLEDLVFHYRDRYHSCHSGRLLEHLRADARFLELGKDVWTLRDRYASQIADIADEARRVAAKIHEAGCRLAVADLTRDTALTQRHVYLLISQLRRDPTLRDLGRGEFCPRDLEVSSVMRDICADLKRAMGELPVWRFLENQPPGRRHVIECLLRENRLFVEPSENRIDLLTNYPFNRKRLQRLCETVDAFLDRHSGYAPLRDTVEHLQRSDLGGDYLTEHLVGDLLRRHGPFEVLPGGVIAQASMGLGGWIQHRAREVLRHADAALTPEEIIGELPELAEFGRCLGVLLGRDALVHSEDDMHYRLL